MSNHNRRTHGIVEKTKEELSINEIVCMYCGTSLLATIIVDWAISLRIES